MKNRPYTDSTGLPQREDDFSREEEARGERDREEKGLKDFYMAIPAPCPCHGREVFMRIDGAKCCSYCGEEMPTLMQNILNHRAK